MQENLTDQLPDPFLFENGALAAWAWGYRRCVDVLQTLKFVDTARIAVIGHSRGGKTVLLAAPLTNVLPSPAPTIPAVEGRDDIMANEDVDLNLAVDWKALGLDPAKTTLTAPEVKGIQTPQAFKAGDRLPVKEAKGLMLIAEESGK